MVEDSGRMMWGQEGFPTQNDKQMAENWSAEWNVENNGKALQSSEEYLEFSILAKEGENVERSMGKLLLMVAQGITMKGYQ